MLWYDITMFHTKSPQAKALVYTILFSALSHLIITFFVSLITHQPDLANMFNVLGVSLLFPELGRGAGNGLLGALTVVLIWCVIFGIMQYHTKKKRSSSQ